MTDGAKSSALRCVLALAVLSSSLLVRDAFLSAQMPPRLSRVIEALTAGRPGLTGESWAWVDQEHRPYDAANLRETLGAILADKNPAGQPKLAPVVRIPMEGDQDVRWAIKQSLESGAMG